MITQLCLVYVSVCNTDRVLTQFRAAFTIFLEYASKVGQAPESDRRPSDAAMDKYLELYESFLEDRGACVREGITLVPDRVARVHVLVNDP